MTAAPPPALALRGVSKRFGATTALDGVDLEVAAGRIHALVGENGAGKSTSMNVAYGLVTADAGEIALAGEVVPRARHSPREALARGVGMVHQHFMLVDTMTVAENVALGREPRRGPFVDLGRVAAELRELGARYGLEIDPDARIDELSVGEQQRVEILKVLWQGCRLLILDEPTAVLSPPEVRELFAVLRGLVAAGKTVVLITHRLDEVVEIADAVTVMRRGRVVAELDRGQLSAEHLARAMVGRDVLLEVERAPATPGEPVLEVSDARLPGRGRASLDGVSFEVRAGEILGVAGVEGNGQRELVLALSGVLPLTGGRIRLGGADVTRAGVRARFDAGLAHVPDDRLRRGLVLDYSVEDNLAFGVHHELGDWRGLDRRRIRERAAQLVADYDIRPPRPDAPVRALSGGNQQKVVLARELGRARPRLLLAAQPTRGVDIGAIEHIHRRLVAARDRGLAILLVSADLEELLALADRVVVMVRGRLVGELDATGLAGADARERIGALMTGAAR